MAEITWRKFRSWSGCKVGGVKEFTLSDDKRTRHMWRALWLTAQVEGGGKFGAVQSYDGAGISAGLEHKIALYPRSMTQGSLWKLLREFELHAHCQPLADLWDALKMNQMYISQDGVLRSWYTGREITAREIRDLVAPPGGRVPRSGPQWEQAKKWCELFHNLFADSTTYKTQINSAIQSLVEGNQKVETAAYQATVGVEHPTVLKAGENVSMELDLAWCVYHSFSVNAPTMGRKRLQASNPNNNSHWPKRLIKTLGTTNYGRWHDTFDGGNRYDRTRKYAIDSGFWPEELFNGADAIMPKNL